MKLVQVFLQIEKDIIAGTLIMPALPAIALKVRKAVKEPNMDLVQLAKIVSLDPSFTAYLISLSNSPMYRGVGRIDSVPVALGRMGMESTKTSALIFSIRSLFKTNDKVSKNLLNRIWKNACGVSALAFVIAKKLKTVDPERASIAGLLHNVGMIPVVLKLVSQGTSEDEILEKWQEIFKFSRKIAVRVLANWGMEDEMKLVAAKVLEWEAESDNPLVDHINLALWHSYLGTSFFKVLPRMDHLNYFKINPILELKDGSLLFVRESKQEIEQMMQAING